MLSQVKMKNQWALLKQGTWLDKINLLRYCIAIFIMSVMIYLYSKGYFQSIRGTVSDTISLSSITLGILGVLIGLLINMNDDSPFFKEVKKEHKSDLFYKPLMHKLRNTFILNLIFVLYTLFFDMLTSNINHYLKYIGLGAWFWSLLIIMWNVMFLIIIIVKIATLKNDDNKPVTMS